MKPLIGIVSLYDEERESLWMLPGYVHGLKEAGASCVILPLATERETLEQYSSLCDGFLFPGGQDLHPELYGESSLEFCGPICPERDEMERRFFFLAMNTGKPMLGICRGIQLWNALLGGKLYQDLPEEFPSGVTHHETPPYDKPAHPVSIAPGSLLEQVLGAGEIPVNSYHHQGIRKLSPVLKAAAFAPDGLTEAVYLPDREFALAVQWHPEFSYRTDENSRKIFRAFVSACHGRNCL